MVTFRLLSDVLSVTQYFGLTKLVTRFKIAQNGVYTEGVYFSFPNLREKKISTSSEQFFFQLITPSVKKKRNTTIE